MSQQVNLLTVEAKTLNPVVIALALWGVVVVGLAIAAAVNQVRVGEAERNLAASNASVAQAKATYQSRVQETGADIAAKIEAIRPKAERAKQLLVMADQLGNPAGYAGHFTTLASVPVEGIWLDAVAVKGSGRNLEIGGRTLNNDAALEYSQRLNAVFADKGVKLTTLELATQATVVAPDGSAAVSSTVHLALIATEPNACQISANFARP